MAAEFAQSEDDAGTARQAAMFARHIPRNHFEQALQNHISDI